MPSATYSEVDNLQAQATALIQELRRAVRLMVEARERGDTVAADAWRTHIQQVGQAYNAIVQRLLELEGPGSAMRFLDRVGDVAITGVKAGATFAISATETVASATGRAVAAATLPLLVPVVLGAALLVYVAGRSGALRVRGVVG